MYRFDTKLTIDSYKQPFNRPLFSSRATYPARPARDHRRVGRLGQSILALSGARRRQPSLPLHRRGQGRLKGIGLGQGQGGGLDDEPHDDGREPARGPPVPVPRLRRERGRGESRQRVERDRSPTESSG